MPRVKRLRIIAGPNGSGKSTLFKQLQKVGNLNLGIFVNADDIERTLNTRKVLSFNDYSILVSTKEFNSSYCRFLKTITVKIIKPKFVVKDNFLVIDKQSNVDSYFALFTADFIRKKMIDSEIQTISMETVMSHIGKLDFMRYAKDSEYRIYLYFVTTQDVLINIGRVETRIAQGGHGVPKDKIESRYFKSLDNVLDAMLLTDRTYFFDNSGKTPVLSAEYEASTHKLSIFNGLPSWLSKYVVNKLFKLENNIV